MQEGKEKSKYLTTTFMSRIKKIRLHIFCILLLQSVSCISQNHNKNILTFGSWQIFDYKFGNISSITQEEAKKFIGKEIKFQKSFIVYLSDSSFNPVYSYRKEHAKEFLFGDYNVKSKDLSIKLDSVIVVDIACEKNNYYDFIIINPRLILYNIEGVFFSLKPVY